MPRREQAPGKSIAVPTSRRGLLGHDFPLCSAPPAKAWGRCWPCVPSWVQQSCAERRRWSISRKVQEALWLLWAGETFGGHPDVVMTSGYSCKRPQAVAFSFLPRAFSASVATPDQRSNCSPGQYAEESPVTSLESARARARLDGAYFRWLDYADAPEGMLEQWKRGNKTISCGPLPARPSFPPNRRCCLLHEKKN